MVSRPFSLEEQFSWTDLPPERGEGSDAEVEALDEEAAALLADAHSGTGGRVKAPMSSAKPRINLYTRANPVQATVTGNFRLTAENASADIRHIILDFGNKGFPVLEGQSIGIIPPGTNAQGRPHALRLYSVASPRDGERPNTNNLALTVKRVVEARQDGSVHHGIGSNYVCDLKQGDVVSVAGPFGATFLDAGRSGRRHRDDLHRHRLGAVPRLHRTPPPLDAERARQALSVLRRAQPLRASLFRPAAEAAGQAARPGAGVLAAPRQAEGIRAGPHAHAQRRHRRAARPRHAAHIYVCGLRGMETGVEASFAAICEGHGLDWHSVRDRMREEGRYHVETY